MYKQNRREMRRFVCGAMCPEYLRREFHIRWNDEHAVVRQPVMAVPANAIVARAIDRATGEIFRNDGRKIREGIDARFLTDRRSLDPAIKVAAVVDHEVRRRHGAAGRTKFSAHFAVRDIDHARALRGSADLLIRALMTSRLGEDTFEGALGRGRGRSRCCCGSGCRSGRRCRRCRGGRSPRCRGHCGRR